MPTYFLGKYKHSKEVDPGKVQVLTETYLIDAVSFTDAEAALYDLVGDNPPNDFKVASIAAMKVREVFYFDDAEAWYKVKIVVTTFDEKSQRERKSAEHFLVQATSIKDAYDSIEDLLGRIEDYEITEVVMTPIVDVIHFGRDGKVR